jgi:peptidoglycan/xylan/chitin deacetylase (PgdA/CDA1 family)
VKYLSSSLTCFGSYVKSAALVLSGLSGIARAHLGGQGCIFSFHGLRRTDVPPGVLDHELHLPVTLFRQICSILAQHHHVLPLSEMAWKASQGEPLPENAVALSFDDGYASNYELGLPVLKEFGLPATVFLATGFLDEGKPLWFHEMDLALKALGTSGLRLARELRRLKKLPDEEMRAVVARHVSEAGPLGTLPEVLRPLTWQQAREMQASGLVEFGGHTHTHPILSRCTLEKQRWEIVTCRDRLKQELGRVPRLFGFPNGRLADYTKDTLTELEAAGFNHAFTMEPGRVKPGCHPLQIARYGAPMSVWQTEATASGAFDLVRLWKSKGGRT